MPTLNNWSCVTRTANPYQAPELGYLAVSGELGEDHDYGHKVRKAGQKITTSKVVKSEGTQIMTNSGTIYDLGTPDPEYLEYLAEKGIDFDPQWPIKLRE